MKLQRYGHALNKRLLALITLILTLSGCQDAPIPPIPQSPETLPVEESEHITTRYYRSSFLSARLSAPLYRRYEPGPTVKESYLEFPKGITIQLYDSATGRMQATVHARYARRYLSRHLSRLRQEVLLVNPKGDSLLTEDLFWDESKNLIYSKTPVRVVTAKEVILAEGFESDPEMTNIRFYKIRGRLQAFPGSLGKHYSSGALDGSR